MMFKVVTRIKPGSAVTEIAMVLEHEVSNFSLPFGLLQVAESLEWITMRCTRILHEQGFTISMRMKRERDPSDLVGKEGRWDRSKP